MAQTPEQLNEELDRLQQHFAPDTWTGPAQEIEAAFGDVENRLQAAHLLERRGFIAGFDQHEFERRTSHTVKPLRELAKTSRPREDKFAAQVALKQAEDGALHDMATDPKYQEQRTLALSVFSERQTQELEAVWERQGHVLEANGYDAQTGQKRQTSGPIQEIARDGTPEPAQVPTQRPKEPQEEIPQPQVEEIPEQRESQSAEPTRRQAEYMTSGDIGLKFNPLPGETQAKLATRTADAQQVYIEQAQDQNQEITHSR